MISNGLVAFSGNLIAQFDYGSALVNMGQGTIVIGLASIIIGEVLFLRREHNFAYILSAVVLGSVIYRTIIAAALTIPWMKATDLAYHGSHRRHCTCLRVLKRKAAFSGKPEASKETRCLRLRILERPLSGTVNEKTLFTNLNLEVAEGEFVTVINSNERKIDNAEPCCRLMMPDSGRISLGGRDITYMPEFKRAALTGRFSGSHDGYGGEDVDRGEPCPRLGAKPKTLKWGLPQSDEDMYKKQLARLGLGLEDRLKTRVGLLSGGQRQALTLLAAIRRPELLLLDEHTATIRRPLRPYCS